MPLILTDGPLVEPVSVPELKAQLRIDSDDEDMLLSSLIVTARIHVEQNWGLALINQGWSVFLDQWPATPELRVPLFPICGVRALRIYNTDNLAMDIDPADCVIHAETRSLRFISRANVDWPEALRETNGVEIAIEAGFGAAPNQAPEPIRQALLLLASWWYEDRDPMSSANQCIAPPPVLALLSPYREFRL
jgi:uncharacterized phiE125 gp8 family phage protein